MNCTQTSPNNTNCNQNYGNSFFIILVLFILLAIIVSAIYAY